MGKKSGPRFKKEQRNQSVILKGKQVEDLSQDKKKDNILAEVTREYSGPLPPPVFFESYEKVLPGAADRILSMAEEESKHRHAIEKKITGIQEIAVQQSNKNTRLGIISACIIVVLNIVCSTICILKGHEIVGGTLIGTTLVALVTAFIYGSAKRKKEGGGEEKNKVPNDS